MSGATTDVRPPHDKKVSLSSSLHPSWQCAAPGGFPVSPDRRKGRRGLQVSNKQFVGKFVDLIDNGRQPKTEVFVRARGNGLTMCSVCLERCSGCDNLPANCSFRFVPLRKNKGARVIDLIEGSAVLREHQEDEHFHVVCRHLERGSADGQRIRAAIRNRNCPHENNKSNSRTKWSAGRVGRRQCSCGWLSSGKNASAPDAGLRVPAGTLHPPRRILTRESTDNVAVEYPAAAAALRYIREVICMRVETSVPPNRR